MIEQSLAGPIGLFIKFSTLQDYGVDKVFFLENDNVDASQKNIIFIARGEEASQAIAVAGMYVPTSRTLLDLSPISISSSFLLLLSWIQPHIAALELGQKVDYVEKQLLYLISLDP